jgi:hypothetical protein
VIAALRALADGAEQEVVGHAFSLQGRRSTAGFGAGRIVAGGRAAYRPRGFQPPRWPGFPPVERGPAPGW